MDDSATGFEACDAPVGVATGDPEFDVTAPLTAPLLPKLDSGPGALEDPRTGKLITEFDGPVAVAGGDPEPENPLPPSTPLVPKLDPGLEAPVDGGTMEFIDEADPAPELGLVKVKSGG